MELFKLNLSWEQQRKLERAQRSIKNFFSTIWEWIVEKVQNFFRGFWKGVTNFVASATIGQFISLMIHSNDDMRVIGWIIAAITTVLSFIVIYVDDNSDRHRLAAKISLYGVFLGINTPDISHMQPPDFSGFF